MDADDARHWERLYVQLEVGMDVAALSRRLGKGILDGGVHIEEVQTVGGERRGFGYISLPTSADGRRLVDVYNNTKWKGFRLHVQPAAPSYMERLRGEWQQRSNDARCERESAERRAAETSCAVTEAQKSVAPWATLKLRPRSGARVS